MMKQIKIAFATTIILASASLFAQANIPRDTSPTLTYEQNLSLYGPTGPEPNIYRIVNEASGEVSSHAFVNAVTVPYLGVSDDNNGESHVFYVTPHPGGGFTIRSRMSANRNDLSRDFGNKLLNCATVARNVVLGPARVDYRACDSTTGNWRDVGKEDQRFHFKPVTGRSNSFQIQSLVNGELRCWAARNNGPASYDIILQECRDVPEQRHSFTRVDESWSPSLEPEALKSQGWVSTYDGLRRGVATNGVNLPGADYRSVPSVNTADACMRICMNELRCKAWTWTAPIFRVDNARKCWVKDRIPSPVNMGPDYTSRISSGIVRP